jgi:hypothetical protein
MRKLEKIERQVEALSPEELAQFRAWFTDFDWVAWDRQLATDVEAGKLDKLARQALGLTHLQRDGWPRALAAAARPGRLRPDTQALPPGWMRC